MPKLLISLVGLYALTFSGCAESDQPQRPPGQSTNNQVRQEHYNHTHVRGNSEMIRGSGNVRKESRELKDFTALEVRMAADVKIVQAAEPVVIVIADDNLQPVMSTEVRGGTLHITANQSFATNSKITFVVSVPVIERIAVKGSGGMFLENVTRDELQLTIEGSGSVGGKGTVESVHARIDGSGRLLLERLAAEKCSVTINGSGRAAVSASESLSVTINGSGRVEYFGNPPQVNKTINGSGRITPKASMPAEKE